MTQRMQCVLGAGAAKCGVTLLVVALSPLVMVVSLLMVVPYVVWLIWSDDYSPARESETHLGLVTAPGPVGSQQ